MKADAPISMVKEKKTPIYSCYKIIKPIDNRITNKLSKIENAMMSIINKEILY
jgi:hypothetical protein